MKKFLSLFLLVVLMSCSFGFSSSALTVNSTYSDVASTSSQAVNLVNCAMSYDSFINSKFVVYCDQQNSYYIVWSDDLKYINQTVTGSGIEYIRYYRTGTGTNNTYTYVYGTDNSFSLRSSDVCTSNVPGFGFKSSVFETYKYQYNLTLLFILICSFAFVSMILSLRGHKS